MQNDLNEFCYLYDLLYCKHTHIHSKKNSFENKIFWEYPRHSISPGNKIITVFCFAMFRNLVIIRRPSNNVIYKQLQR